MRATDIDGRSRMSVAQQSFNEVVDALSAGTQLGIRVLGSPHPGCAGDNQALGCRDTQQLSPVGPVNKVSRPRRDRHAAPHRLDPDRPRAPRRARDLGTGEAPGGSSSSPTARTPADRPACATSPAIAAQGTHLVVDTLGLTLDDKVRRQLTCIADATGGTYTAVQHQTSSPAGSTSWCAGPRHVSPDPAAVGGTDPARTRRS